MFLGIKKWTIFLAFCVSFTAVSLGNEVAFWVFQSPPISFFLARVFIAIMLAFGIVVHAKAKLISGD
jgi:hypothetical protein